MPSAPRFPAYQLHKPSGQAVVTLNGKDFYLGLWKSDASRHEYDRLIAEWISNGRQFPTVVACGALSVAELLLAYLRFAKEYYSCDGVPTSEYVSVKYAVQPVRTLYARIAVQDFGPRALKAVRQAMIDQNICRKQINLRINRVRRVFKWGVENELVPPQVLHGVQAVAPLKKGRTAAPESKPIKPVPDEHVDAVLPLVSRQVATMIELHRLSGMRPGEVVLMRPCDIDRSNDVWIYRPAKHKTAYCDHEREIYLGPKAQALLVPWMSRDGQAYCFSPAEAEVERNELRRKNRRSPMTPSQAKRNPKTHKPGYRCGHFGKWHVGTVKAGSPTNPGAMGFGQWVSHDNFFELNPSLSRNGAPPQVINGESSEVVIDEAIRFIDEASAAEQPFLTVVWFGSPHEPYSGLPADLAFYDDLPAKYTKLVKLTSNETGGSTKRPQGEVLRERYAEITAMDRAIGKLRKHLASQGLKQDTLLFYCGDNGTSADAALGVPHRGTKGTVYEGGTLVPGLIEWPARIRQPRSTAVRACTSDLLPTLCSLVAAAPPDRPLDGIDLTPVIDGKMSKRPVPLCFWEFDTRHLDAKQLEPWIDPEQQKGTTPLVKLTSGKATRDFTNYRHPTITHDDYRGPRAVIDGRFKLVIHERSNDEVKRELFDLEADPSEKNDLANQRSEVVDRLDARLREWQDSVLLSLTGVDYAR